MNDWLPFIPCAASAVLLVASIFLLRPFFRNSVRIKGLWKPTRLARPLIHVLDGCAVLAIALLFAAVFFVLKHYAPPDEELPALTVWGLLLTMGMSLVWVAPAAALLYRDGATLETLFGIRRETAWRDIRLGLRYGVMMLCPVFLTSLLTFAFFTLFGLPAQTQGGILQLANSEVPLVLRATLGVVLFTFIPVVEEVAFRGILLPAFARVEPWRMLMIGQAVLFSAIHCNAFAAPALFVAGLCFGLGYTRTRSVLTPIAMHAVFNFNAVLLAFAS